MHGLNQPELDEADELGELVDLVFSLSDGRPTFELLGRQ